MRILALAILLPLLTLPVLADDTRIGLKADQVGEIFCLARLGNDTGPIDGLLTEGLETAIADAETKNAAWEEANPGEKPPLGDGVPWQSWPDYAPKCAVGLVSLMKSDARVEIAYTFPGDPEADFTDTLLLKRIDQPGDDTGAWRIDNIAYDTGGDLRTALAEAFAGL